jgi:hypothetical protein
VRATMRGVVLACGMYLSNIRVGAGLAEARRGADPRRAPRRVAEIGASRGASRASAPSHCLQEAGKQTPQDAHRFCSVILS